MDIHTTHTDKASADTLGKDPEMFILGEGAREVPAVIVLMLNGINGVLSRDQFLHSSDR